MPLGGRIYFMNDKEKPIGVFDSGLGGVSVLKELLTYLPNESFIYYADNLNAPYGTKKLWQVQDFALTVSEFLINEKQVKAVVVACNTATSAAIKLLRSSFSVPIIGMEPALKPAITAANGKGILVMATPMTLRESKFQELMQRYGTGSQIITLPCPGLVELIESGHIEGRELDIYLKNLFADIDRSEIQTVVLGCTHYIFIREQIARFFPGDTRIVDGNLGTAKQLARVLAKEQLLIKELSGTDRERVEWFASGDPAAILKMKNLAFN